MVLLSRVAAVRTRTLPRTPALVQKSRSFMLRPGHSRYTTILSGFAGGAVAVLSGGYVFYHWSGLKELVEAARHPIDFLKRISQRSQVSARSDDGNANSQVDATTQILAALRLAAKAHVVVIAGADILVDMAFDAIDKVADAHKEEAAVILKSAYEDMQRVAISKGSDYKEAAWEVLALLRVKLSQIQALAGEMHQDRIGPLFDRFPGFYEHASTHIAGVRDSLAPKFQRGLEKGKDILSRLSKKQSARETNSPPSEAELERNVPSVEEKSPRTNADPSVPRVS